MDFPFVRYGSPAEQRAILVALLPLLVVQTALVLLIAHSAPFSNFYQGSVRLLTFCGRT
jgi:hypothetical protein